MTERVTLGRDPFTGMLLTVDPKGFQNIHHGDCPICRAVRAAERAANPDSTMPPVGFDLVPDGRR